MNFYIEYFLLGLSLAAPIGPINAAQIERGIRSGFLGSWVLGLGSILGDLCYLVIVYFGTIHFLEHPFMRTLLWTFGCFALLYTGIESLITSKKISSMRTADNAESLLQTFTFGFFLSVLNPLSIMFWIGIYGSVLADAKNSFHANELWLYTSCILAGLLVWDLSMATISSQFKRFINVRFISVISVTSGLMLVGFGLYFGIEAIRQILSR